jgi:hypothetical protein
VLAGLVVVQQLAAAAPVVHNTSRKEAAAAAAAAAKVLKYVVGSTGWIQTYLSAAAQAEQHKSTIASVAIITTEPWHSRQIKAHQVKADTELLHSTTVAQHA